MAVTASIPTIIENHFIYILSIPTPKELAIDNELKNIRAIKKLEEVMSDISAVLYTILGSFSLDAKRKKAVSNPYVKTTTKNATYAYISITIPYSCGKNIRVYSGTSR
jgi:hypothetical protein